MRVMENNVYRHMRSMADSYKARTGRDFWEDLRSAVGRSDCPSWIRKCFDDMGGMA